MSNVLKVSLQTTIYSLADRGWSQRRIARELGIIERPLAGNLRLAQGAKPAISTLGSPEEADSKPAILSMLSPNGAACPTIVVNRLERLWKVT